MRPFRVVTAASLFDGHDAAINLFRRLLQDAGFEVIHLGHNRSVNEVVAAISQEDADAVMISCYQGGHNQYFQYLVDRLKEVGLSHVRIFGGGGGTILPAEIAALEKYGVERLYHAETGRQLGLDGMIADIKERLSHVKKPAVPSLDFGKTAHIARALSQIENEPDAQFAVKDAKHGFVLGITGAGGAGKSSLTDELCWRLMTFCPEIRVCVLATDPTKSRSHGALLGDRIRMNSLENPRLFMRSFATRESSTEISACIGKATAFMRQLFDLVIIETTGIGQASHEICKLADSSCYVMTAEFGAPSQLDKIDMLDLADFIVVNKKNKPGAEDAVREILLKKVRSARLKIDPKSLLNQDLPVYATEASRHNDAGVNQLFLDIAKRAQLEVVGSLDTKEARSFVGSGKLSTHYLSDIATAVERYHKHTEEEASLAKDAESLKRAAELLPAANLAEAASLKWQALSEDTRQAISHYPQVFKQYQADVVTYTVRGKSIAAKASTESLSSTRIPKVSLPKDPSWSELVRFVKQENLPGSFPYTAGVFPFKRTEEDPKRQFAGEGTPEATNRRLHYLSAGEKTKRLSIAFDGVTLYGENPDKAPDIWGKVGDSGVSICTLDDMKKLFAGFDLIAPETSVSMTINGPAPIILAMYFNTAVSQQEEKLGRKLQDHERLEVYQKLRGTVQADILKEDQGQNTCIFSIDYALKMMGDVQSYFCKNQIRNYYSVSISGYHIAEAGANPISQLAFTLANGFHYVETYKALGLAVDDFAENFSFFFSNGMDPEYAVIGRVARRIWAIAMRDVYKASSKSQKLKYHIQTSGRSLHAQEIDFNDIRTTLEALYALSDNCNSLHTNSYDEAVTTPTEESVRRSMAIQLILTKEFGLLASENYLQGSYFVQQLTDLVEAAVLEEFRKMSFRGGVLGSMEKQYQRSKIQEESLLYEQRKHDGSYPLIGVNTFLPAHAKELPSIEVRRASEADKQAQLDNLQRFKKAHAGQQAEALARLKAAVLGGKNVFEELLQSVQHLSLGEISQVLYELGGKYRRNI